MHAVVYFSDGTFAEGDFDDLVDVGKWFKELERHMVKDGLELATVVVTPGRMVSEEYLQGQEDADDPRYDE